MLFPNQTSIFTKLAKCGNWMWRKTQLPFVLRSSQASAKRPSPRHRPSATAPRSPSRSSKRAVQAGHGEIQVDMAFYALHNGGNSFMYIYICKYIYIYMYSLIPFP